MHRPGGRPSRPRHKNRADRRTDHTHELLLRSGSGSLASESGDRARWLLLLARSGSELDDDDTAPLRLWEQSGRERRRDCFVTRLSENWMREPRCGRSGLYFAGF